MKEKDILQKIIDEEGNCCWAKPDICEQCPLSKLKKRDDGSYYSCVEAVRAEDIETEEDMDARYKEIATRILLDMSVEEFLLNDIEE